MKMRTIGGGLLTLAIGAVGGAAFMLLSIPLPWVLGSLAANALVSQTGFKQTLPQSWRGYAMVIIGTMLGAGFTGEDVAALFEWLPSIIFMALLSLVFMVAAFAALRRWSDMDPATAFLAAVPGGLSVVTAMADDYKADVRRIALSHTARLVTLLVMTPFMLMAISDYDLSKAARDTLSFEPVDPVQLGLMLALALLGFALAKMSRLPSGLLIIPLVISAIAHVFDLITIHMPGPISIVAQVIIGSSAGIRFTGYRFRDVARDGWLSALIGIVLALASFLGAVAIAALLSLSSAPLLLAYLPGGAPELGVVSIAVNADPALVAVHHVVRVFLIIALTPVGLKWVLATSSRSGS